MMNKPLIFLLLLCIGEASFAQSRRPVGCHTSSRVRASAQRDTSAERNARDRRSAADRDRSSATPESEVASTALGISLVGLAADLEGNIWPYGYIAIPGIQGLLLKVTGERLTPILLPEVKSVTDLVFVAPHTGWMIADGNKLYSTRDGGTTWQKAKFEGTGGLLSIVFSDPQHGWMVGSMGVIYHTEDGGLSWQRQDDDNFRMVTLERVISADAFHCWAIGKSGEILTTNDGGQTWKQLDPEHPSMRRTATFVNSREGWGLDWVPSAVNIVHTTDGGETWEVQRSGNEDVYSLIFFNEHEGIAIGSVILRTQDGGRTWKYQNQVDLVPSSITMQQKNIVFADRLHGWAVSNNSVYLTVDAGQNWQEIGIGWRKQVYEQVVPKAIKMESDSDQ